MENYRRFLELQNTDPALRAEAMRRLGDLSLETGELERMADEVTRVDLRRRRGDPAVHDSAAAYPDYPRNDQVLYQLARAYETTGQGDKALATLDEIVARYPGPRHRRGAVPARRAAVLRQALWRSRGGLPAGDARGPGGSTDQSLYKHGWSLFKQAQ